MHAPNRERPCRGGIFSQLLVLLAALLALGAFAWMLFLPEVVTGQIRSRTGFDASVASLSCNPFTGRLTIRGLVLTNPATFPTGDFVQLREFRAVAGVWSLFSERLVFDELALDVRKVELVRRADGRSNAEEFGQNLGLAGNTPAPPALPESAAPVAPPARKFLIRRLALRFDQLVLADYTGEKPDVREFNLAVDQHYENITEAKQLLVPDVLRRVTAENLGPVLSRLVPGDFGRALGDSARDAAKSGEVLLKDAGEKATDLLRGLREKLEESKKP
jgi:hypothetical protein